MNDLAHAPALLINSRDVFMSLRIKDVICKQPLTNREGEEIQDSWVVVLAPTIVAGNVPHALIKTRSPKKMEDNLPFYVIFTKDNTFVDNDGNMITDLMDPLFNVVVIRH